MNIFYYILFFLLFLLIGVRIVRFFLTPVLKSFNLLKYYNPLFLVIKSKKNINIHLGLAWDVLNYEDLTRKKIMEYIVSGLLNLINEIETGKISSKKIIRGNPYFFKPSSFERYGFKARKLKIGELIFFYLNFIELCFLQSIRNKRISIINAAMVKMIEIKPIELLKHKEELENFYLKLTYKPFYNKINQIRFNKISFKQSYENFNINSETTNV